MLIKMAALLSTLGHLMTLTVWVSLSLGPVLGGYKVYKGVKEEQRQEQVRQKAALKGLRTGPRTFHV